MQTIRRFLLIAFVMTMSVTGMASSAPGGKLDVNPACMPFEPGPKNPLGPIDSWPWGSEIPFPWRGIQGVWMAEIDGCANYFSFKVVRDSKEDERILQVWQVDPVTCQSVARGVGYGADRIVTAVMAKLAPKRGSYELKVQAFKETDLKSIGHRKLNPYASTSRNVTVLTMNPIGRPKDVKTYQLYKLDTNPENVCQ